MNRKMKKNQFSNMLQHQIVLCIPNTRQLTHCSDVLRPYGKQCKLHGKTNLVSMVMMTK